MGYDLRISGLVGDERREFIIAIGKAAQAKYSFQVNEEISGASEPVMDARMEVAEFFKTSKLKVIRTHEGDYIKPPPYHGIPLTLEMYRARGHRRLHSGTYDKKCLSCLWGCRMPVEMTIDHWNPSVKRYRYETFCYGPKSCSFYKPGPKRHVPGRKGITFIEEDWIDEEAIRHRGPDD